MIADLYARLSALTGPYTAALIEATDEGEAFAEANKAQMEGVKASNEEGAESFGLLGKASVGIAAAFVAVSAVSIKWATDFQSTMETLHTQAGVAQNQIGSLGNGVLALAGQVGFAPNNLAEALYHIESSFQSVGITGPAALNLLKIAAEGAAVGHADLVDVTNALDAAIASGIPGVQNYSQAMGVLNSIVGSGDMTMQDLANAFSTGALANVKSYGASITDVGAALAVFGDNNIRGQNAATDLRMSMQALQVPAATSADLLAKMGMNAHTLGTTMSQGGLLPALELLHQKLTSIGITTKTQGAALTELFGKKAGAGIVVLYDQLGRLQSKYPDLNKGATDFADAWAATKQTVKQQLNEIGAGVQAAGVRFGEFLLPQVQKLLTLVTGKGASALGSFGHDLSQLGAGFMGNLPKAPAPVDFGNAGLNQMATVQKPPDLTAWQQVGVTVRGIANDFERFGKDAMTAGEDAVKAAKPVAQVLAGDLGVALAAVGKILANVVGPVLKDVFGFLASHQGMVKFFAEVILGGLIVKMLILKSIGAATAITNIATSIVNFPTGQVGQIGKAFQGLKTSWLGAADKNGQMVGGLKNALASMFNQLRGATRTALSWGKNIATSIASGVSSGGSAIAGVFKKIMPTKLDAKMYLNSVKDFGGTIATTIKGWGSGIADAASSAATGLGNLATSASTAVASFASSAWTGAMSMLSTLGTAIAGAATAAWGWVTSATAATLSAGRAAIAWTADALALVGTAIAEGAATAAQWLLNLAMWASPLTWIVIAIMAVVGVFVLLWMKCAWFRDFWKALWADIKKLIADAVSFVKDHFTLIAGFVLLPIVPLIYLATHWKQIWSDIKDATLVAWHFVDSNVIEPVKRVFTNDLPAALRTYERMWIDTWDVVRSAAMAAWNWVNSNVLQPVARFFASTLGGALATGKSLWNSFWGGVQTVIQGVWNVLKPIFNAISSAVSTVTNGINAVKSAVGSVGNLGSGALKSVGGFLSKINPFEDGGFVPGGKGMAQLAIVHGGEYVVSNAMLSGSAPIDNRVLTGVLSAGGGQGGGSASALAVRSGAGGGGSVTVINVNVQVAGNVTAEKKLSDTIRTQILQYAGRNVNNGLSLTG